jgi:hypothetical protein
MLKPQMDIDMDLPFTKHIKTAPYEIHDIRLSDDWAESTFSCENLELDELDDLFQSY